MSAVSSKRVFMVFGDPGKIVGKTFEKGEPQMRRRPDEISAPTQSASRVGPTGSGLFRAFPSKQFMP
jgi:hypothetical protein